ncbi:MAG: hypothetical protein ACOCUS_05160 [Polyangiales bacterium]
MSPRPHIAAALAAAVAAAAGLAACSAIVQPPGGELRCEPPRGERSDPCPGELVCSDAGVCEMPGGTGDCEDAPDGGTGEEELCNGIDDDCDGTVDEGHDMDGDGFTWCGSGDMDRQDCDDNDPDVYPAADGEPGGTERCNGQDDDCDGEIDEDPEGGPLCPEGEQCLPLEGGCIEPDCTITGCPAGERCDIAASPATCTTEGPERCDTSEDCDADMVCDTTTGNCFEPKPLGESCTVDKECESGLCMSASALGVGEGRVCGTACCSSAGCPSGTVCWVSEAGARSCLPAHAVGVSEPGTGMPGDDCSSGGDCRSGICGAASGLGCVGHCTSGAQCGGNDCTLARVDINGSERVSFVCAAGPGSGEFGDDCGSDDDCRAGACIETWLGNYCTRACGSQDDCPFGAICDSATTPTDDVVSACFYSGSGGEPLCCSDGQCESNQRCQEVSRGGGVWQMSCQ